MNYPEIGAEYLHYKGGIYRVLFLSKHSETDEVLVNYQSVHFGSYHTRPLSSWNEKVTVKDDSPTSNNETQQIKRFRQLALNN